MMVITVEATDIRVKEQAMAVRLKIPLGILNISSLKFTLYSWFWKTFWSTEVGENANIRDKGNIKHYCDLLKNN